MGQVRARSLSTISVAAALSLGSPIARALPPRYDHVVVLVLENSTYSQVLGDTAGTNAPYLNDTLAAEGTKLSAFYGLHHPSVQNYAELFAGYDTGATGFALAPNWPLTTPNLGAALRQNGYSFAGYSESMPSIGYTEISDGSPATPYASRHNPWVNWQNDAPNAGPNQLPSTTNLRFADFPAAANYAQLPTVAFVVPDNNNNMHNGGIPDRIIAGDAWIKNNIDAYYQWARTHNSLLIVTCDEDDFIPGNNNNAPTVFAGAGVKAGGILASTYTLHNVLRTLEDMYALPHAGASANVRAIVGAFTTDPTVNRVTFRQAQNDYTGAKDTYVRETDPTTSFATAATLHVDLDDDAAAGNQRAHALLRFDDIIAGAGGTIPTDATILSAKLTVYTTSPTLDPVRVHRMVSGWSETATWSSLSGGILADGIEAAIDSDFTFAPSLSGYTMHFDVSDTLQRWVDGTQANNGWAILPTGTDGFGFDSAEGATIAQRPQLEVSYALYPRFTGAGGSWNTASNWANGTPGGSATVARFLTRATAATLTLDGSKTVGTLLLDSPAPYTINPGTGGTLTFANAGNVATLQAKQGQHTLNVPLSFIDPGQLDVAAGAKVTATAGLIVSAGKPLTKLGSGTIQIRGDLAMGAGATLDITAGELSADRITGNGALTVRSGATARLTAVALASTVSGVTLAGTAGAWTGKIDLGRSGLTIDYAAGMSPLATTIDQIKFARDANWTGAGIGSAAAAATPGAAVAVSEASALLGLTTGQTASFMGQTVDNTTLLLRFTAAGDATMDGTVDFLDLAKLAQNYNIAPGIGAWAKGDFNYDGIVDFLDLAAMAQNYNTSISLAAPLPGAPADFSADLQAAFAQANAPEPTALPFLAFALGLLRNRRNR